MQFYPVHWLKVRCGGKSVLVYGIAARGSIQKAERLTMSKSGGETHGESMLEILSKVRWSEHGYL